MGPSQCEYSPRRPYEGYVSAAGVYEAYRGSYGLIWALSGCVTFADVDGKPDLD